MTSPASSLERRVVHQRLLPVTSPDQFWQALRSGTYTTTWLETNLLVTVNGEAFHVTITHGTEPVVIG